MWNTAAAATQATTGAARAVEEVREAAADRVGTDCAVFRTRLAGGRSCRRLGSAEGRARARDVRLSLADARVLIQNPDGLAQKLFCQVALGATVWRSL